MACLFKKEADLKYTIASYYNPEEIVGSTDDWDEAISMGAGDQSKEDILAIWNNEQGVIINTCFDGLIYFGESAITSEDEHFDNDSTTNRVKDSKLWYLKVLDKNMKWKKIPKSEAKNPMLVAHGGIERGKSKDRIYAVFVVYPQSHPTPEIEEEMTGMCYEGAYFPRYD